MRSQILFLSVAVALVAAGCDSAATFDRDDEVVVEAYLVADADFGQVRLSRTQPVENAYDFSASAISDAAVSVRRLAPEGGVDEVVAYAEDPQQPGVYLAEPGPIVRALATYELMIDIPSTGEKVSSRTTVPGAYSVIDAGRDTVVYQSAEQAEVLVTRSAYPGRQAVFVFSVEALDPSVANLTPFYREVADPDGEEDVEALQDFLINESPPLNEEGYDEVSEDVLRIKVPWLGFAFYGRNRLRSNALDDNIYDFVRSQSVQQGGSTFAPGEIPNILDRVEGGTGVFGSYSVVETEVFLARPPGG